MGNAKHTGCTWALAVALGIGLVVSNSAAVASAAPDNSDKGSSSSRPSSSDPPSAKKSALSATNDGPKRHRRLLSMPDAAATSTSSAGGKRATPQTLGANARPRGRTTPRPGSDYTPATTSPTPRAITAQVSSSASPAATTTATDPDFISSTHNFGLFSVTTAADPDDNNYVAFVLSTPLFTNVLTSGTDPEDNLGFGPASIGVAGQTVNTFTSPLLTFSVAVPIEDPFAELFTELVRLGF